MQDGMTCQHVKKVYLIYLTFYIATYALVQASNLSEHEDSHHNDIADHGASEVEEHEPVPHGNHYGYSRSDGPAKWATMFSTCGGVSQSPINLDTSTAEIVHKPLQSWWGYSLKPTNMTLTNNGHTVVLQADWPHNDVPYNWDSEDDDDFVFAQLHFHWGPNDDSGSEHTLNGEKFPLEMHAVHYRRSLGSLGEAAKVAGGLKVIGVLFRISEHTSPGLSDVLLGLPKVKFTLGSFDLPPFTLSRLIPQFSKQFLTYNGSLTTPPCSESVKWVVYKQPSTLSRLQVDKFRYFINEGTIVSRNFRPTQPLNNRKVQQIR